MEQFKLPFPKLQFLASHAIARRMVLMKVNNRYWLTNRKDTLKKCELRVRKLPLPPVLRKYVKYVLRGLFQQVKPWIFYNDRNPGADVLFDAHGNVDERSMMRHHFEKRHKDKFFREDFQPFVRILEHLSWYHPEDCNNDFVSIIGNLQKVNTSLEGPEYRLVGDDLQVVFRFVNRLSVPTEFNALLEWNRDPLEISMEQKDVLVTYRVYEDHYDEDMFGIHVDILEPSERLPFVKKILYNKMELDLVQEVIRFLNVLGPEMRRNCLLGLNEDRFHDTTCDFLRCLLMPGYECLFIPMMQLVGLNLDNESYFDFFAALVDKMDLIGFDKLLLHFWELLPARKKGKFHRVLERPNDVWHGYTKRAMKKLSKANADLFQVVFDDVSDYLTKRRVRRLLSVIMDE